MSSLWAQLLLQFYTKCFETLQVFLSWSDDVHVLIWLTSHLFLSTFSTFQSCLFQVWLVLEYIPCGCNSSYSFPFITFKLCRLVLHGLKMCMWFWGYTPVIFFYHFFFSLFFYFPGPISTRIDTLWAQILLEFSTNHFETTYVCSTWSEDVCCGFGVILLSYRLKLTTFTNKAMLLLLLLHKFSQSWDTSNRVEHKFS